MKMKVSQILLLFVFLLVANSQNLQAEVEDPIYNPYKDICSPVLMQRLANPTSTVSNEDAFLRLLGTLKFARDPQTLLNDLSFYSPRFVGLLLTYIQQKHLLLKRAQATDPAIRSRCLSRFKAEDCTYPCNSDKIATPQDYNNLTFTIIVGEDSQCEIQQFDNFYYQILNDYPELQNNHAQQQLWRRANQQDSQATCNQVNYPSSMVESECIMILDRPQEGSSAETNIQDSIDQLQTFSDQSDFSSMIELPFSLSQPRSQVNRPQIVKDKINLRSILSTVRRLINFKFGNGIFAEKSLRCIRADYLLMQTV